MLDIGSGWGDMALYLARVWRTSPSPGVTLSKEQYALSNEKARRARHRRPRALRAADYREVETASTASSRSACSSTSASHHYGEFFAKINELLADDGVMLLHSIGHMSPPGTASPVAAEVHLPRRLLAGAVGGVHRWWSRTASGSPTCEFLRVHYAKTLQQWERRFEANRAEIAAMYDERFCRMWEFYLISAEMMFRTGSQLVFHMQLAKNATPRRSCATTSPTRSGSIWRSSANGWRQRRNDGSAGSELGRPHPSRPVAAQGCQ